MAEQRLGWHMGRSALLLGLFALVGTGLVAITYTGTEQRIADAERSYLLRSLNTVIPPERYNNNIFQDSIEVSSLDLLGTSDPVPVFRARQDGQPVAVALTTFAPDGYGGPIKLLVGIYYDGSISGVRVLNHKETPGLGDVIEEKRSDWVLSFDDRSLTNPELSGWNVRRDGGVFDQFTGATITPRAVVKAVHNALKFYDKNRDKLYSEPTVEKANG